MGPEERPPKSPVQLPLLPDEAAYLSYLKMFRRACPMLTPMTLEQFLETQVQVWARRSDPYERDS